MCGKGYCEIKRASKYIRSSPTSRNESSSFFLYLFYFVYTVLRIYGHTDVLKV